VTALTCVFGEEACRWARGRILEVSLVVLALGLVWLVVTAWRQR
jgi:hypothetical protein